MKHYITLFGCLLCLVSCDVSAKQACKPYLDKLTQIQAKQRAGYSNKQGDKLRQQAKKARDKWWQCEQSSSVGQQKSHRHEKAKNVAGKGLADGLDTTSLTQQSKPLAPFHSDRAIVVKGQYQGKKQQAWLSFYRQPTHCQRPKTTQAFALCVEDKERQRQLFEQQYRP